jgi:hypothetical protein
MYLIVDFLLDFFLAFKMFSTEIILEILEEMIT